MEQNFVVIGRDGTLSVVSGKTGQVRVLEGDELKKMVAELIKQRQDAGEQLTKLLGQYAAYDVADIGVTGVIDTRS